MSGEFVHRPGGLRLRGGRRPAATGPRSVRDERDSAPYVGRSVVVHDDFDWGDDRKIGRALARHRRSTSCTSRGSPQLHDRIPEELRGHVRRARPPRGHRLPARPRRHRGGAAADPAVRLRAAARRARAEQLLGLQHDRLLRPARGVLLLGRPRRAGHRVQADGEELPRGRHRGLPRRRLQPHGRGRRRRADAELPRARRPRLLQAGRRTARGQPGNRTPTGT